MRVGLLHAQENPPFEPFYVYFDQASAKNHFYPTGWMGDYGDIEYDDGHPINPHSGTTCIRIVYSAKGLQGARWAGIYWQNPPNNWGDKEGSFDLTGATKLTFWARSRGGGEVINEFKIGGIGGKFPDSATARIGPVKLTREWKQYTINLNRKKLTHISGGFCWATSRDANRNRPITFFLDDIRYE